MFKSSVLTLMTVFVMVMGCGGSSNLRSSSIPPDTHISGQFDLILYTSLEQEVLIKVAVLDPRGDSYKLTPNAAEFNFKRFEGLRADAALKQAEEFLSELNGYEAIELREIKKPEGKVVAIEIRPLYDIFLHGTQDIINTNYYTPEEGIIKFIVRSTIRQPMQIPNLMNQQ